MYVEECECVCVGIGQPQISFLRSFLDSVSLGLG